MTNDKDSPTSNVTSHEEKRGKEGGGVFPRRYPYVGDEEGSYNNPEPWLAPAWKDMASEADPWLRMHENYGIAGPWLWLCLGWLGWWWVSLPPTLSWPCTQMF